MSEPSDARILDLAVRVRRMTTQYVRRRTESRSDIKWDDFKDRRTTDSRTGRVRIDVPEKYPRAWESVCNETFLTLRACRSRQDFVEYFTGTICSVPQFLPVEDYRSLAVSLLSDDDAWESVKALSMLTLSELSNSTGGGA